MNQAEINDILIDINANLQLIHTKLNNLENMVENLQKKIIIMYYLILLINLIFS